MLNAENTMPEGTVVGTLDAIKAKLAATELQPTEDFFHAGLGMVLRVGGMSSKGYDAVANPQQYYPAGHSQAGQRCTNEEFERVAVKISLLMHAVHEPKLDYGTASQMLDKRGWGKDNEALFNLIRKLNPPAQYLTAEVARAYGFSRATVVLVRVLERAGLWSRLNDYLTLKAGDPICEAAAADLQKWRKALPFWESVLEAEDAAKSMEISVYEAAKLNAGEPDAGEPSEAIQ